MSASPESLSLALLGCGSAATTHSRVLRGVDGVRLHYASRDPAKAADFARRFGGVALDSYDDAFRRKDIDVIVVLSPHAHHLEQTLRALESRKAVVVEKPAFLQTSDFARVGDAAAEAGRRVYVAENYVYKPLAERLRRIIAEGGLGEPLLLQLNAIKRQRAEGWRADAELAGGGALLDGGIHWVSLMGHIGLQIEDVTGFPAGLPSARSAEETQVVVVRYHGGAVGVLSFSWEVPSAFRGLRMSFLYGREGTLRFESNGLFALAAGRRRRLYLPGFRDLSGFRAMWTDFLSSMRSGREPLMTLERAEQDVHWVRRAYASAP